MLFSLVFIIAVLLSIALLLGAGFVVLFFLIRNGKVGFGAAKLFGLFGVIVIMGIFVLLMGGLKMLQG